VPAIQRFPALRLLIGLVLAAAMGLLAWRYGSVSTPGRDPRAPAAPRRPNSAPGTSPREHTGTPRIVALSPALAIILRDLGLESHIVGRHAYDMVLPPSVPVCGNQTGIDYEALIGVRPTDVLLQWGRRELPARLQTLAREHHWAVSDYELLALDDVLSTTADLNRRFAAADPQHRGDDLLARMRTAWAPHPGELAAAGRILLLESIDPPAALGPGSFHHQILERLGATPAITAGKPFMTLDAEGVLSLAPDGIIIFSPRERGMP
jgi:ABC-type Fe3+-hydroxamate transport system substrate-binding protein